MSMSLIMLKIIKFEINLYRAHGRQTLSGISMGLTSLFFPFKQNQKQVDYFKNLLKQRLIESNPSQKMKKLLKHF